uniref:Regulatory subunit of type II PKA R-subunit domain containing 1 n=1 Tax=Myotis myotis TaxID=51298 RepID=A0A7J7STW9_MYOMY|nr:regulatory subunit of type II PKA R-subunit domain containing 1 [Myotis myotis]
MTTLEDGQLGPDPGALSPEQLEKLRDYKIQTRIANEKYLRSHEEVELLLRGFYREMFLKRPENIREFAAGHLEVRVCCHQCGFPSCLGLCLLRKGF